MWNSTRATQVLQIKYPILQGPFGGNYSTVQLATSVSNLGGMGAFGLNSYSPEEIISINNEIQSLTTAPYVLNLWVPLKNDPTESFTEREFDALLPYYAPYFKQLNLPLPTFSPPSKNKYEKQIEAILDAKPPVASFIFGVPSKPTLKAFKDKGILTMATATTLEEALYIESTGIDLIVASGTEAGGHRASFLKPAKDSLTCTQLLIHQIKDNVNIPVVAAGGISNGKDVSKVLQLGADAAQLGTAFLATQESNASALHKEALLSPTGFSTDLTSFFTGRLGRAISNNLSKKHHQNTQYPVAPFPIQSTLMSPLRKAGLNQNQLDFVPLWAGQPSAPLKHQKVEELFNSLLNEI